MKTTQGVAVLVLVWSLSPVLAQATPQDLGDEELAVKGALFVGHNLKDVFHVPALAQHRDRDNPLHFAGWAIDQFEPRHIGLVLLGRRHGQDLCLGLLAGDFLPVLEKALQLFRDPLAIGDGLGDDDGQGPDATLLEFPFPVLRGSLCLKREGFKGRGL